MALRIGTNVAALNTQRNLGINDANMSRSLERLSSGYRINSAKDDAAGLGQGKALNNQNRALVVASRNVSQANAMLQIAEGGADQIQNMLLRLKELATQAASQNSNSNLSDINNEATALKNEINRIANSTKYLDQSLLTGYGSQTVQSASKYVVANVYGWDASGAAGSTTYAITGAGTAITMWKSGDTSVSQTVTVATGTQTVNFSTFGIKFSTTYAFTGADNGLSVVSAVGSSLIVSGASANFQIGQTNNTNFQISFQIDDLQYTALGSGLTIDSIDLSTLANAQSSMDAIDIATDQVSTTRAKIGALQNRLDYTNANISTSIENFSAAESVIRDVDMAAEMTNFTKNQIMIQAGTAMLAQANTAPQMVLQLLGR